MSYLRARNYIQESAVFFSSEEQSGKPSTVTPDCRHG